MKIGELIRQLEAIEDLELEVVISVGINDRDTKYLGYVSEEYTCNEDNDHYVYLIHEDDVGESEEHCHHPDDVQVVVCLGG